MSRRNGLDRRSFLKTAGAAAALGALGARNAFASEGMHFAAPSPTDPYDFDEPYSRLGTHSTKWDGAVADFGEQIEVGMGIADMDFRAPTCITRAIAERCEHENWGYIRIPDSFNQAVADWEMRRHGLEVDPATITRNNGVHPGLISGYHAFVPPGGRVLMTTPVYSGFYGSQRFARVVAEESPMHYVDGRYSIDWDDFERRVSRCNVFLLCNPQNPTGNCWSAEDMLRMGQICLEHRVIVFSDEIHCDLVPPGSQYIPFASLPDQDVVNNSITFKAVSKTFNLPGLKMAWYYSTNPDLLERIRSHTRSDLATLAVVATQAGLEEGDEWLDQLLPYLGENHRFAEAYIEENIPTMKYRAAEGTYLAWLDVNDVIEAIGAKEAAARHNESSSSERTPAQMVQRWLAEHAGVALNPGSSFGVGGEGHMRMNLATQRATLETALERMADALSRV